MKGRVNYLSVPIELISCPFFSEKEKQIITTIIRLSDKFLIKGGCNLTNKQIAFQHRAAPQIISNAISKANKLGFVVNREDIIHRKESEINKNEYSTERKIQMKIPKEWVLMGDLYNHAFIYQDENICKLFKDIEKELKNIPISNLDQEDVVQIIEDGINIAPLIQNYIGGATLKGITSYKGIKDNKSIKKTTTRKRTKKPLPLSYDKIYSTWNNTISCNGFKIPSLKKLTPSRKLKINTRNKSLLLSKDDWLSIFKEIKNSDFLDGDNDRGWTITFDWLIESDKNFNKVLEGNFRNKDKKVSSKNKNRTGHIPGKFANVKTRKMVNGKFIEE